MNKQMKSGKQKRPLLVIGWMEGIDLPKLGLKSIKAKIDTGARTSALHAVNIEPFERDGENWVRFRTRLQAGGALKSVEARIHETRAIKNTGGVPEDRIVIRTKLHLSDQSWTIAVSLADRTNMRFPMIVGRTALKSRNIAVHTRRANLLNG